MQGFVSHLGTVDMIHYTWVCDHGLLELQVLQVQAEIFGPLLPVEIGLPLLSKEEKKENKHLHLSFER